MYSDVVSSVPVMFERPANRLSGYKYQEGGALSLETKFLIRSKASSLSSKLQLDLFSCRLALSRLSIIILQLRHSATFIKNSLLILNDLNKCAEKIFRAQSLTVGNYIISAPVLINYDSVFRSPSY